MDASNYFIKKGYKIQDQNYTYSKDDSELYWNDSRIFLSNFYQYDVYKFASKIIKKNKLKNVADVGCGVARKLVSMIYPVCHDITGIDQKEAIEYCMKNYSVGKFIVENLEESSPDHGPYDCIICADVIEHMTDPDALLTYIRKLSHQDSYIIISTPERDILRGKENMGSPKPEHIREWNSEELKTYLLARGFEILEQKIVPFMGFSFDKRVRDVRRDSKNKSGTIDSTQIILCKLKNIS